MVIILIISFFVFCVRVVHSGTKNSFNMPLMLSFWGQEENKKAVMESMARRGYKLNTGGGKATGTSTTRPSHLTRLRADVSAFIHN